MAHYAFLDENNIVTEVITGRDEWEVIDGISNWEEYYGNFRGQRCVRTSYNNNIRKVYAGIGFRYDEELDIFIPPQPFPSWTLDENHDWVAPVPMPEDIENGYAWIWDESIVNWTKIKIPENY